MTGKSIETKVKMTCPHCGREINVGTLLGREGGLSRSIKKSAASRENGKKGGRPRKSHFEIK
jgi:hypothetical protein